MTRVHSVISIFVSDRAAAWSGANPFRPVQLDVLRTLSSTTGTIPAAPSLTVERQARLGGWRLTGQVVAELGSTS